MADTRSENAEMDIGRLNVRIDKVMVIIIMMMLMMMINIGRLNVRIDKVLNDDFDEVGMTKKS